MTHLMESMTCRQFVENTTEYLEGALDPPASAAAEAHLTSCDDCASFLDQMELTIQWASEMRAPVPSEDRLEEFEGFLNQARIDSGFKLREAKASSDRVDSRASSRADSKQGHADQRAIQDYLLDRMDDWRQIETLGHLVGGCEICAELGRKIAWPRMPRMRTASGGGGRFQIPQNGRLQRLAEAGYVATQAEWLSAAATDAIGREQLVRWMVQECRYLVGDHPQVALALAEVCSECSNGAGIDARAQAAMLLGHVSRIVQGDYLRADRCFSQAQEAIEKLGGGVLLLAKVFELRAMSRFEQSRSEESLDLYVHAAKLLEQLGEWRRLGRLSVGQGGPVNEVEGPRAAVAHLLKSSFLIDYRCAPRYGLAIVQNLSLRYAEISAIRRAELTLRLAWRLAEEIGICEVDGLKLAWAEGRVCQAAGRLDRGARLLGETREAAIALGLPDLVASVSLDLSLVLLGAGKWEEVAAVLASALPILESCQLRKEELAAVTILRQVVEAQSGVVSEVWRALGRLARADLRPSTR